MDPRTRQQVTHYGAPAAFLAAVTIAVILIKAGLNGGSGSTTTAALPTTSTATKTTTTHEARPHRPARRHDVDGYDSSGRRVLRGSERRHARLHGREVQHHC